MSLTTEQLTQAMESAVQHSIDHVEAGGLPFVGVVLDQAGEVSGHGVNEVARTRDPTAHAEIMAMRQTMRDKGLTELAGHALLATGEPCGICYRFALDHGIEHVYVAVDAEQVAAFGIDYRSSYPALGIDRDSLSEFISPLPVAQGSTPFTRYLNINHPGSLRAV